MNDSIIHKSRQHHVCGALSTHTHTHTSGLHYLVWLIFSIMCNGDRGTDVSLNARDEGFRLQRGGDSEAFTVILTMKLQLF